MLLIPVFVSCLLLSKAIRSNEPPESSKLTWKLSCSLPSIWTHNAVFEEKIPQTWLAVALYQDKPVLILWSGEAAAVKGHLGLWRCPPGFSCWTQADARRARWTNEADLHERESRLKDYDDKLTGQIIVNVVRNLDLKHLVKPAALRVYHDHHWMDS